MVGGVEVMTYIEPAPHTIMTEEELRSRWPAAFNDERKSLARGIHANMGIAYGDPVVGTWVLHPRYLRNQLASGAVRIDLAGNAVGIVSQEEREVAWRALLEARDWIYRQERERLKNPIRNRWLHFSVEDEKQEMKQRMPRFPKQQ
jgi:sRNA-binding protein